MCVYVCVCVKKGRRTGNLAGLIEDGGPQIQERQRQERQPLALVQPVELWLAVEGCVCVCGGVSG
jgi:hypothetical protein